MSGLSHSIDHQVAPGDRWFSAFTGFWTTTAGVAVFVGIVAVLAGSL